MLVLWEMLLGLRLCCASFSRRVVLWPFPPVVPHGSFWPLPHGTSGLEYCTRIMLLQRKDRQAFW